MVSTCLKVKLLAAFEGKLEDVYPTRVWTVNSSEEVPVVVSDAVIKLKKNCTASGLYPSFLEAQFRVMIQLRPESLLVNWKLFVTLMKLLNEASVDTMVDNT